MSNLTKPTYKVSLSNASASVLRHHLNQAWTKSPIQFIVSCELLARVIPEPSVLDDRPHPITSQNYPSALAAWKDAERAWGAGSVPEFTLSEQQRDVVKACLRDAVEKQQFVPSKPAYELWSAFGLIE